MEEPTGEPCGEVLAERRELEGVTHLEGDVRHRTRLAGQPDACLARVDGQDTSSDFGGDPGQLPGPTRQLEHVAAVNHATQGILEAALLRGDVREFTGGLGI